MTQNQEHITEHLFLFYNDRFDSAINVRAAVGPEYI